MIINSLLFLGFNIFMYVLVKNTEWKAGTVFKLQILFLAISSNFYIEYLYTHGYLLKLLKIEWLVS